MIIATPNLKMRFLILLSIVFLISLVMPFVSGAKFVCYYPSWAQYRNGNGQFFVANINPNLCTHLMYSFANLNGATYQIAVQDSWADISLHGYSDFVGLKAKNPNLKTMISIGGWTDSTDGTQKYSKLVASSANIASFVSSVMTFLQQYGFDGLDLDWEAPSSAADKAGFAQLLKALRSAFNVRGYLLSAAVAAWPSVVDSGYDLVTISQTLDFMNLMTYDMHGTWESTADNHAPLYKRSWETTNNNIDYVVKYYIGKGFPAAKIILGIPIYGHSWTLTSSVTAPPAPASGPAPAGPFVGDLGSLSYSEICYLVRSKGWTSVQDPLRLTGPYAYSPTSPIQWVGYDDPASAVVKSKYVLSMGLGGAMVWEISQDDFRNTCNGGANPVMTAISQTLLGSNQTTTLAPTTPTPVRTTTQGSCSCTCSPSG